MSERLREVLAERGAIARLARELGISHAGVSQWLQSRVPAERVLAVERVTGISRYDLRPDIYGSGPPIKGGNPRPEASA